MSSLDNINNRPIQPDPRNDPELGASTSAVSEQNTEIDFTQAVSKIKDLMELDPHTVETLLANLSATNPHRPDMAFGKQPDVAAIDQHNQTQSAAVPPAEAKIAGSYGGHLAHINSVFAEHDAKLGQIFDALALSRSGRKPELFNQGADYERLMAFNRQVEAHRLQTLTLLPETLPSNTGQPLKELMPEFAERLVQYDREFKLLYAAVEKEQQQAKIAAKARRDM